ncbi:ribosome maturation factor RimP [bacterium]|nr:ribosome maturation factor RimP [candidate division CSSED10-310 bacterium]
MNKEVEQIVAVLAESVAESLGMSLLEVRFIRHQRRHELRITLDRLDQSVSIDDCTQFSRQLARRMDLEDPISDAYVLEVSSPGFRRLIRISQDLPRFIGRRIKIRLIEALQDRTVWIGILQNDSDPLHIMTDEVGDIVVPFSNVKQLNLHE